MNGNNERLALPISGSAPEGYVLGVLECCPGHAPKYIYKKKEYMELYMCPNCGLIVGATNSIEMATQEWNKTILRRDLDTRVRFIDATSLREAEAE